MIGKTKDSHRDSASAQRTSILRSDHPDRVTPSSRVSRPPGPSNPVLASFARSGQNSVREQLTSRRLELRDHNDLLINGTLTVHKNVIYQALLDAEKTKIYAVFSIWGNVYFQCREDRHWLLRR